MKGFDDIRPYRDEEVQAVLERLVRSDEAVRCAAIFLAARAYRFLPTLTAALVRLELHRRIRDVQSVDELQLRFSRYFERVIERSTAGLTVTGVERLPDGPAIFISNHRDIALDSGFMNYALWSSGRPTSQIAVGDNLFTQQFATDLMRLNKSFVVRRRVEGPKAQLAAIANTSAYIRAVLEAGDSIWIAQRQGRAKNGYDKTEPAVLKMFTLAYRKELDTIGTWLDRVALVPVSVTYELDPCASTKARELYETTRDGAYQKDEDEDLMSIVKGIVGYKGRVSVAFGERITGEFQDFDTLAERVDKEIAGNLTLYPTHLLAWEAVRTVPARAREVDSLPPKVGEAWLAALDECAPEHVEQLLLQYANQVANQRGVSVETSPAREPANVP